VSHTTQKGRIIWILSQGKGRKGTSAQKTNLILCDGVSDKNGKKGKSTKVAARLKNRSKKNPSLPAQDQKSIQKKHNWRKKEKRGWGGKGKH